jgi:hypothetical protein
VFRYSRLDRWFGGGPLGDLYDRSLSVRVRLFQETDYWPSVAVGARDILGTGAFGGEYLVASKQFGDIDVSAGLGWRRLAGLETIPNPLGWIFPSFKTDPGSVSGSTGRFLGNIFFHGPDAGLFGGVTWQTPINGLTLIAELSGDKFSVQQATGAIKVSMPLNFGFSYEPWTGVQIGGSYLYGSQFGLRLTIFDNAFDTFPARLGIQPPEMHTRTADARNEADLDSLQAATQFYNNRPPQKAASLTGNIEATDKTSSFVDVLFDISGESKLSIVDAQTFGDSLVIQLKDNRRRPSCGSLNSIMSAAGAAGFHQVAFWSPSISPR